MVTRHVFRTTTAAWAFIVGIIVLRGALLAEADIVFSSRVIGSDPDSESRTTAIEHGTSGRLLVREASGAIRVLVDASAPGADPATPADVMDPDVSWDGTQVVFAGYSAAEGAWRIYLVGADGAGLRQVTRSDRVLDLAQFGAAAAQLRGYDDVDPCWLPDGRICLVSTRYPTIAPDGRRRGTNLYVVNPDGTDLHRITTERFGADTPAVDPSTGKIVYSRWWRSPKFALNASGEEAPDSEEQVEPGSPGYGGIVEPTPVDAEPIAPIRAEITDDEFPGLNNWFLAEINPDGSGMKMLSGMGLDRELTQAWKPSFGGDGSLLALFIPRTPFLGLPRGDGVRSLSVGAVPPQPLGGPQSFALEEDFDFVYASSEVLSTGELLVAAAPRSSPRDYDIYTQAGAGAVPVLLFRGAGTSETGAVPLAPRPVPPVLSDSVRGRLSEQPPRTVAEAYERGGRFTFLVENIFGNAPVGMPIANAPPAVDGLTIQFFMNPQRTGVTTPDEPILVAERQIDATGRVEVELPAGVPLFEVLRTRDELIPVGRDGQIFHVGGHNFGTPGKTGRCIGCHVGHSMLEVPADPIWTNLAPSAAVTASSARRVPSEDADEIKVLRPENLVDRRIDGMTSEWAAETSSASVELRWSRPIRAREVVLYGIEPGEGEFGPRDQVISSLRIVTLFDREVRAEHRVDGGLHPSGTRVPLDTASPFNRMQVIIRGTDVVGLHEGKAGVAIAEIEVTGRITESDGPLPYLRGDGNCDGKVQLSDAVMTLNWLFRGGARVCCLAAADFDDGGVLDISDPTAQLNFLFLGGPEPAPPFPECGPGPVAPLSCDGPTACP